MMSPLFTLRNLLVLTAVALAVALGFETEWGSTFSASTTPARSVTGKQDNATVLPDFRLSSESTNYAQISERPLLNPSRKPAPTQVVVAALEPAKPSIRRGLYQLIGVTDLGGTKFGQVREISTGRVQSVKQGQSLQEMTVKAVDAGSVTLMFANESDVLELPKYTASGRVPQPVVPTAAAAAPSLPPQRFPMAQNAVPPTVAQAPTPMPSQRLPRAESLADVSPQMAATLERRRLAREQQAKPPSPSPPPPPAPITFGPARPSQ